MSGSHFISHLTKIRIQWNPFDNGRGVTCVRQFLQSCGTRKAQAANPKCQVLPKTRTDNQPPVIELTFNNGKVDVLDCTGLKVDDVFEHMKVRIQEEEVKELFEDLGLSKKDRYIDWIKIEENERKAFEARGFKKAPIWTKILEEKK
mmetsp:Transcript_37697/g.45470  ORF Transcript_37697/g.45470 Transcript_37697/m.45470 type:complete len:147 (-) Transcript_37697:115-555(-)|eukprot:CAMPEP_0197852236 /NCGR_PEP_ID=MMETSP1438-20131217/20001_1 /TAXON_ID=1461541 /ORGANISM="Pterosperma sp., Strain CCMP1384" /LENGTH=146 /DNA_ID=CAMNT_0043466167 /DNA_START=59 /DNA_END=499 /DNA_ORIENTATION=+